MGDALDLGGLIANPASESSSSIPAASSQATMGSDAATAQGVRI